MSLKKKLGSKLANSVRQVKSQREQNPAVAPAKIAPTAKQAATPTSVKVTAPAKVTAKPVAPRAAQQTAVNLEKLHPSRVWPD